jgi:hypothetical protein
MKNTKKAFEQYLNDLQLEADHGRYIIGGKLRNEAFSREYGTALRKYDPIAFQVAFNEWKLNKI